MGARAERRSRLRKPGERKGQHLSKTQFGKRLLTPALFLGPLVEHLRTRNEPYPGGLDDRIRQLPPEALAQAVLSPMLHRILAGWWPKKELRDPKKSPPTYQLLCGAVGLNVHRLLIHHHFLTVGRVEIEGYRASSGAALAVEPQQVILG
jgi:hypothetical protein